METIRYSLFDFFSYLLPGFVLLSAILLAPYPNLPDNFASDLSQFCKGITNFSLIYLVVISYGIGFCLQLGGSLLFRLFERVPGLNPVQPRHHGAVSNSVKLCTIREKSPQNFKYVETWNVLSAFSINLAISLACGSLYLHVKSTGFPWWPAVVTIWGVAGILVSISIKFNNWSVIDLDNTYNLIDTKVLGQNTPPCPK